jgi:hypothetical protein
MLVLLIHVLFHAPEKEEREKWEEGEKYKEEEKE